MATVSYLLVLLAGLCIVHGQVSKTCQAGVSYVCHGTDVIEICANNDKPRCSAGLNQTKLCSAFSQCTFVGNNVFDLTYHECAVGHEFCDSCKKCVPKEEANCSQDPLQSTCVTNKKIADTSSCDIYWLCNAERKFVQRFCNLPTPHFDANTENCVNNPSICGARKDVYSAITTTPASGSCEYGQRFAVNDNCRQYDECDAQLRKVRRTCYYSTHVYQVASPTTGKCVPFSAEICLTRPYIK
ncbi:hypothetical protein B566_EDAN004625 [Ephemera danica]|nr:hypothetical protein B566_EDAN004625 [Ephemera danica]